MSNRSRSRRWGRLAPAILLVVLAGPGCKSSQLQTARVISEDRNMVVIAIPENTTRLRDKAEKLAQNKLGKDIAFVEGKEVNTADNVGKKTKKGRGMIRSEVEQTEAVYRREYQVTFKAMRSTAG